MSRYNLWTRDDEEGLSIQGLPGGAKIILHEGYISRKRRIWEIRLVYPRTDSHDGRWDVLETTEKYSWAKEFAETWVEENFELWLLALHKTRPPQLGVDIMHPDGEGEKSENEE